MENKIKKSFEILVLTIYTFFTFKIVYPFLIYFLTYKMSDYIRMEDIMREDVVILLNRSLVAIVVGLFLNAALIIYLKVLPKRYTEVIVLTVYTFINFKLLSVFLFDFSEVISSANYWHVHLNFPGLFMGLFLNVGLIFYWLRRK